VAELVDAIVDKPIRTAAARDSSGPHSWQKLMVGNSATLADSPCSNRGITTDRSKNTSRRRMMIALSTDNDIQITPEWLLSLGMTQQERLSGSFLDFDFVWTENYRSGDIIVVFTFEADQKGAWGKRRTLKTPKFAWASVNGGRIWQRTNRKAKRFVPTRGQVRMMLRAFDIRTLEG
jgi:hypothetical protein